MSDSSSEEGELFQEGRKPIKKQKRGNKKTHRMISSTFQKKECDFYNRGSCNKGSHCTFSHSFVPDVAKKICKFFLTNSCSKGAACPYSHNTKRYPCKFHHIQNCCRQGDDCRFSHENIDPDFLEEFLKDSEDCLLNVCRQGKELPTQYLNYIRKNNLLVTDKSKEGEGNQPSNIPFIFGLNEPVLRVISPQKGIQKNSDPRKKNQEVVEKKQDPRRIAAQTKSENKALSDPRLRPIGDTPKVANLDPRLWRKPVLVNSANKSTVKSESPSMLESPQFSSEEEQNVEQCVAVAVVSKAQLFYLSLQKYMRSQY